MTNETVAAVVPVYNKEPYVSRAIGSILAQTRPVDEIIVVDDASTDGSVERIEALRDPRLRLLRRRNPNERGLPATRNLGIRSARSRWIALLDADDNWHADFIEEIGRLIAIAPKHVGCIFTGWQSVWSDGVTTRDPYSASCDGVRLHDLDSFVANWVSLGSCPIFPSGVVLRRDVLLKTGLFHERCRRGEDKEMWLRMIAEAGAISSPRVCSSYYRGIPGQMNTNISTNARHCVCATLEQMIAHASGTRRHLLMRLFNHEVFEYARAVGLRERISPDVYRGFFASISPHLYVVLLALSYAPLGLQHLARQCILWTRATAWKPRSARRSA